MSAWATTRGRPYEIIFMRPNNNLPVCFLLGTQVNPFPNPIPGVVSPCDKQKFTDKQAITTIRTKAAGCGEAAHFPCQKHGK